MKEIAVGSEIKVPFVITRLAKAGEMLGNTPIYENVRKNLWWAAPVGSKTPELLICTDGLDTEPIP